MSCSTANTRYNDQPKLSYTASSLYVVIMVCYLKRVMTLTKPYPEILFN